MNNNIYIVLSTLTFRSRTSSEGIVDDSKFGDPRFQSNNKQYEKNLLVLLDKTLYLMVVLENGYFPLLQYEYGKLIVLIAT